MGIELTVEQTKKVSVLKKRQEIVDLTQHLIDEMASYGLEVVVGASTRGIKNMFLKHTATGEFVFSTAKFVVQKGPYLVRTPKLMEFQSNAVAELHSKFLAHMLEEGNDFWPLNESKSGSGIIFKGSWERAKNFYLVVDLGDGWYKAYDNKVYALARVVQREEAKGYKIVHRKMN